MESNPPSLFGKQESCGHRYTLQSLLWEPGGRRRSGLQPGMNQKNVLLGLDVDVLKLHMSTAGCADYLGFHWNPRGDKPGGDSEVEPGRRVESKETLLGG